MKRYIFALLVVIAVVTALSVSHKQSSITSYRFANLEGPTDISTISQPTPSKWQRYADETPGALALLLTDENSSWLGLVQGLKTIGIPFYVTRDYRDAIRHRVIVAYPALNGRSLPPEGLQGLAAHVRAGGTLLAFGVDGGGMPEVFRFETIQESVNHSVLAFTDQPAVADFVRDPAEATIRLFNPAFKDSTVRAVGYLNVKEPPLAIYEDGTAAITQSGFGKGKAYAVGMDIGHALLQVHGGRLEGLNRSYINAYEPGFDLFLRLIRRLYQAGEPDSVVLHTVPDNKALSVLMTHDIDFTGSMKNAAQYAALEKSRGVSATYFTQTKYVRDYNDNLFLNEDGAKLLVQLDSLGVELASHSVAHSKIFKDFPMGSGRERYPDYTPFVKSFTKTSGGSILGELRVSRFLLEHFTPQKVESFRPGHLSYPRTLPQALLATGYRFSSSLTANEALTNLPFPLMYDRAYETELELFEFPITVEDELAPRLLDRLPHALAMAKAIGRYGGTMTILIHPNITGQKLEFEKRFLEGVKPIAWLGSVRDFGRWWGARNKVKAGVETNGKEKNIRLSIPETIEGLTLEVPPGWKYRPDSHRSPKIDQIGRRCVIGKAQGEVNLVFTAR